MDSSDMGLLCTLDALLQESSVTKAAKRLGLSTPAVSHALAKLRKRFGDPLLVRAGQRMVLTPRAEALRPMVRDVVAQAQQVYSLPEEFSAAKLERTFVVGVTDYVLLVLGETLDRLAREQAPELTLRFVPNSVNDAQRIRAGELDLVIGIYGSLPPELKMRQLLTDRFVCVLREAHPVVKKRLTLAQFVRLAHVQVAPRGQPGGYLDDLLAERGLQRKVARALPFFQAALALVSQTDYVLTISERIATTHAPALGLRLLEPPLPLAPYALSMLWHPRFDKDAGHRWLRDLFVQAAAEVAPEQHQNPRRRLDPTDPTTGQTRKLRKT